MADSTSLPSMTTPAPPSTTRDSDDTNYTGFFIGAIFCMVVGGILLIIGIVRLIVWVVEIRNERQVAKKKHRHLEHMRHLEEYSMKAGTSPNDVIIQNNNPPTDNDSVFKWNEGLVNAGYISQDTLERHSPKEPKLAAHATGSVSSYGYQMAPLKNGNQTSSRPVSSTSSVFAESEDHVVNNPSGPIVQSGTTGRRRIETVDVPQDKRRAKSDDRLADVPI